MFAKRALEPFAVRVHSSEIAIREALRKVLDGLGPLDLDIEEAGTVELVLAEALNNIVEHAYAPQQGVGPVLIRCLHKKNGLHFRIEDRGVAMPEGHAPLGVAADLTGDFMDLPEGGFGWFIIQDLAKDVKYQRVGNANLLNLRLAVGIH
ncbi:ATP-binding protein [Sulfitobacter sp. SK012]|uniref:ATP-binding protein n=1 Tax=Sulfitobacter sp. SK012 TaxID=1389005 RepID=UPI000E0B800C|nr:ATP-binding protein [Sulfitobacter sp. SK012]AXI44912.1 ATP-binding protein [Sulfitobacter sp. SK012]